ncbi:MAG: hypothetical protein K6G88_03495 [Lachnospiraceae bacterium]|nr:hypothetical protein [Lachnospiraceae bacterium]
MNCIIFKNEKKYVNDFINLPVKLYGKDDNMESPGTVKQLLLGNHPLSKYFTLYPFLIYSEKEVVGRFAITAYENDDTAYLGFFECIDDNQVSQYLFECASDFCRRKKFSRILGPVDASFWMKYRLKINRFDEKPYTGEPYNKSYYYQMFLNSGFEVMEHYTSNNYRAIDTSYENEKYEKRYREFLANGYEIKSPTTAEYDKTVEEVYELITDLYKDFPIFKDLGKEDFKTIFADYKTIMNMSMTKIAYYKGKAVGFYISIPDYGNRVYHLDLKNLLPNLMYIMRNRKNPKRYVMLYMGVDREHRGLGKALVYSIMKELMNNNLPSIGALARDGKVTQTYAFDDIENVYEYVLLGKKL